MKILFYNINEFEDKEDINIDNKDIQPEINEEDTEEFYDDESQYDQHYIPDEEEYEEDEEDEEINIDDDINEMYEEEIQQPVIKQIKPKKNIKTIELNGKTLKVDLNNPKIKKLLKQYEEQLENKKQEKVIPVVEPKVIKKKKVKKQIEQPQEVVKPRPKQQSVKKPTIDKKALSKLPDDLNKYKSELLSKLSK